MAQTVWCHWPALLCVALTLAPACGVNLAEGGYPDDWLDPTDMVNYNPTSRTMRRGAGADGGGGGGGWGEGGGGSKADEEERWRLEDYLRAAREELSSCLARSSNGNEEETACREELRDCRGQRPPDPDSRARSTLTRFLRRLLKEVARVGQPSDSKPELHYDGHFEVRLQDVSALAAFLDGGGRAGGDGGRALEFPAHAVWELLERAPVRLRQHDPQLWIWSFADTFGVEAATVAWVLVSLLAVLGVVATEMWARVSWLTQMWRLMIVVFVLSVPWTWLHLYKLAFAERQARLSLNPPPEQCLGTAPRSWLDSLSEWSRQTFTLQDEPCLAYYRDLVVDPFLEVPPSKALMVTLVTFVLEPAKYFGQALSDFLRATYRNLPVQLQLLATLIIMSCIAGVFWCMAQGRAQRPRARLPALEDEDDEEPGGGRIAGRAVPRLRGAPRGRIRQRRGGAAGDGPGPRDEAQEECLSEDEEHVDGGRGGGGRVQDVEPQTGIVRRRVGGGDAPDEHREPRADRKEEAPGSGREARGRGRGAQGEGRDAPGCDSIDVRAAQGEFREAAGGGDEARGGGGEVRGGAGDARGGAGEARGREGEAPCRGGDAPYGWAEAQGGESKASRRGVEAPGGVDEEPRGEHQFRSVNISAPVQETAPVSPASTPLLPAAPRAGAAAFVDFAGPASGRDLDSATFAGAKVAGVTFPGEEAVDAAAPHTDASAEAAEGFNSDFVILGAEHLPLPGTSGDCTERRRVSE